MATDPVPSAGAGNASARSRGRSILHAVRRINHGFWTLAVLLLIGFFLWHQRGEIAQTIVVLRTARIGWAIALVLSALGMHVVYALTQSSILARLGYHIPPGPALLTYTERQTVATVVPVGGIPSAMVLMRRFASYGVTSNDALLSVALFSIIGHMSFIAVLMPVIAWLILNHIASGIVLIGASIFLIISIAAAGILVRLIQGALLPSPLQKRLPAAVTSLLESIRQHNISLASLLAPFACSLLGDALGIASVYLGLVAVRADATVGTAIAGYTVGTLFLLVAPVFQGIGIVEVSMTLALQQLGIPAPQALGATVLYRLGEIWLPVILGVALQARHQKRLLGFPARLPALFTAASGAISVLSVMPHRLQHPTYLQHRNVSQFSFLTLPNASRTVTLAAGFLLILLASSLLRRQRAAWILAVMLTTGIAVSQLTRDIDRLGAILAATNLAILLLYANRFRVKSDLPTMRRGLTIVATTLSLAFAYGVSSLWLVERRHFGQEFSLQSAITQTIDVYFSLDSAGLAPRTEYANWLATSFHLLGGISLFVALFALIRPIVWRHRTLPAEREHARHLISTYGNSSLDRFKYWPDKLYFFSSTGEGVVSYGRFASVALALGDPNARDARAFQLVLHEFLDFCDSNGWQPGFHQVSPAHLREYREEGLVPIRIGADAIVRIADFSLQGKAMKGLRAIPNRFARVGMRVEILDPPINHHVVMELKEVSDAWLDIAGRRERAFTLGQFTEDYVAECPILLIRSSSGRVEAFINIVPDGVEGELTFDLMRHRADAPNGAMDMLMIRLIEYGKTHGFRTVSLGMVPFVSAGTSAGADIPDRAVGMLSKPLGRYFASESLWNYKNKFRPVWEPRYLIVRSVAHVPQIALAMNRLTENIADQPHQDGVSHE